MARETRAAGAAPLGWDDLCSADHTLFLRDVDGAVARRDDAFFAAQRALWLDWVATGAVGLIGMLLLGWSATTSALLLLASYWLGWFVDLVQWRARSAALDATQARESDDARIWQIAAVLRGTRRRLPDARGQPGLGLSIAVDLVAGLAATALLVRGFEAAGAEIATVLRSPALLLAVGLLVVGGTLPLLFARLRRSRDGTVALPPFRLGQRGIGLLVLVFALMAAGGGSLAPAVLLACAFGLFALVGTLELVFGVRALRRETEWLRQKRRAPDHG